MTTVLDRRESGTRCSRVVLALLGVTGLAGCPGPCNFDPDLYRSTLPAYVEVPAFRAALDADGCLTAQSCETLCADQAVTHIYGCWVEDFACAGEDTAAPDDSGTAAAPRVRVECDVMAWHIPSCY